jgi:hypothetical protein
MAMEPMERRFTDLTAFCRIFEVMAFVDRIRELTPEEIEEATQKLCELPSSPERTMSMEEVVFWAGVATGMDVLKSVQDDLLDDSSAEKIQAYSSLLAYSTKNALVDLTLQELEVAK